MADILKGAPVAEALTEKMITDVYELRSKGIEPTLAILRVGERPDDISYERGAVKRAEKAGVTVKKVILSADISQDDFDKALTALNEDDEVHGILMFRPLPEQLDNERARKMLAPEKDIDGCTDGSLAGVFTNTKTGFPPCTAQAAMEILHHYGVEIKGKKAAVIGRSLVIGRPVAMMLMHENATVVNCHTKTADVPSITRKADILIAAAGVLRSVNADFVNPDQVVIDVGINWDEEKQGIAGDVDFDSVEPVVKAITPVPGGVGTVTTCVLISHVIEAAKRLAGNRKTDSKEPVTGDDIGNYKDIVFIPEDYKGIELSVEGNPESVTDKIIDIIAEKKGIIYSESLINSETEYLVTGYKQHLKYAAMGSGNMADMNNIDMGKVKANARIQAIHDLNEEIVINGIIKSESIDVFPNELEEEALRISREQGTDIEMVKRFFGEDFSGLTKDIQKKKARRLIYDEAKLLR